MKRLASWVLRSRHLVGVLAISWDVLPWEWASQHSHKKDSLDACLFASGPAKLAVGFLRASRWGSFRRIQFSGIWTNSRLVPWPRRLRNHGELFFKRSEKCGC